MDPASPIEIERWRHRLTSADYPNILLDTPPFCLTELMLGLGPLRRLGQRSLARAQLDVPSTWQNMRAEPVTPSDT
jgi:hypothetical protein